MQDSVETYENRKIKSNEDTSSMYWSKDIDLKKKFPRRGNSVNFTY